MSSCISVLYCPNRQTHTESVALGKVVYDLCLQHHMLQHQSWTSSESLVPLLQPQMPGLHRLSSHVLDAFIVADLAGARLAQLAVRP